MILRKFSYKDGDTAEEWLEANQDLFDQKFDSELKDNEHATMVVADRSKLIAGDYLAPYSVWCTENCIGTFCTRQTNNEEMYFYFSNPDDAIHFKVVWA